MKLSLYWHDMNLDELKQLRALVEADLAQGVDAGSTLKVSHLWRYVLTPALMLELIAVAEAHTADCTSCGGSGDWLVRFDGGFDVEACSTCKGTGQQCVGYSGLAEDGNGPVMEPCGECGYGSDLPEEILFTEAWKRRFQYNPSYQFFDTRGGWLTPKDDPVHMGWEGWKLARAVGSPPGAAPLIDWPAASDWWSRNHIDLGLDQDEAFMRRVDLLINEPHLPELRKSALVNRLSEIARPAIQRFYELGYKAAYVELGKPEGQSPLHYYNEGHKSGYDQASGDKDDIIAAVKDDLLDKIIKRHGWFREEVRHEQAMVFRMNLLITIRDALRTVNELTVDDIAG